MTVPTGAVRRDDEYEAPADQVIAAQLALHGYQAADIRGVIITHLHEDHAGNLNLFPHAPVYLGKAEYDAGLIRVAASDQDAVSPHRKGIPIRLCTDDSAALTPPAARSREHPADQRRDIGRGRQQ